jgi:hypothetical protein
MQGKQGYNGKKRTGQIKVIKMDEKLYGHKKMIVW